MNKTAKTILIAALCAVLVLGGVLAFVLVPKLSVPHAKEYAAQFAAFRADYDAAAAYLKTLTKKDPASAVTVSIPTVGEENTLYFFRDNGADRVKTIAVSPEDMAHLDAVAGAFAGVVLAFKSARVLNGNVTFSAEEDAYRVLCLTADEKPAAPEGWKVKKLDACWFQMIRVEK